MKFTKLNIGDVVSTSGTRVFKKLSTEEPDPRPVWDGKTLTGTTWYIRGGYAPRAYCSDICHGYHWGMYSTESEAKSFGHMFIGYEHDSLEDNAHAREGELMYTVKSNGPPWPEYTEYGSTPHYVKFTTSGYHKETLLWVSTYGTLISHRDPRQVISFNIGNISPAADKGSTWETWIASNYNMQGVAVQKMTFEGKAFNAVRTYQVATGRYTLVKYPDGRFVEAEDDIIGDTNYILEDVTDDAYTKYTGTWVLNDVLSRPTYSMTCKFAFTHDRWNKPIDATTTEIFSGMAIGRDVWSSSYCLFYTDNNYGGSLPIYYDTEGAEIVYYFECGSSSDSNNTWYYGGEKTINILSDPTDEAFLAWFTANAKRVTTIVTPGLYDADNNLVASWYNLTRIYGMDVEKNYTYSDLVMDPAHPYQVLTNNSDLSAGTKLTIPDGVTTLGKMSFYGCDNITSVTLPASIETIDVGAFYNCTHLTDVHYSGTAEQWDAVHVGDDNTALLNSTIHFNWSTDPVPGNYISFSGASNFAVGVLYNGKQWNGTIEYSPDAIDWKIWSGAYPISSNKGRLYLRGIGTTRFTGASDGGWCGALQLTGSNISCKGNIENLLDYQTVANGGHPGMSPRCFEHMFVDCTNLVEAPELCATTLSNYCYYGMFRRCTGLTVAPALPASELTEYCYYDMFEDCSGIRMIDLTGVITLSEGIRCISSSYDQVLRFGTNLKTITSGNVFVHPDTNQQHQISIRYEFTDDDTPEFNTSYVVSPGRGKGGASYRIYTDNTAIKDGALSVADKSTTVIVYHLNGEVWV